MGPGGLGQRLSTLSGGGLWAQVWFGQPATLRVSRNRDSSGKSAKEPARAVVGGDGRVLDALLSDQEIDELDAFLASEARPQECMDITALDGLLTAVAFGPIFRFRADG